MVRKAKKSPDVVSKTGGDTATERKRKERKRERERERERERVQERKKLKSSLYSELLVGLDQVRYRQLREFKLFL